MQDITLDNFDAIVEAHDFLVIDFWASWCAPCQGMQAILEKAEEANPDIAFAKIDIDAEEALAAEFDVQSVPRIMILREQVVVYDQSGALSAAAFDEVLQKARDIDAVKLQEAKEE